MVYDYWFGFAGDCVLYLIVFAGLRGLVVVCLLRLLVGGFGVLCYCCWVCWIWFGFGLNWLVWVWVRQGWFCWVLVELGWVLRG